MDVSIQESVIPTMLNAPAFWDLNQVLLQRAGSFRSGLSSQAKQRVTWACEEIYRKELGLSREALIILKQRGVI